MIPFLTFEDYNLVSCEWIEDLVRDGSIDRLRAVVEPQVPLWVLPPSSPDKPAHLNRLSTEQRIFLLYFSYCLQQPSRLPGQWNQGENDVIAQDDVNPFELMTEDKWLRGFAQYMQQLLALRDNTSRYINARKFLRSVNGYIEESAGKCYEVLLSQEIRRGFNALVRAKPEPGVFPIITSQHLHPEEIRELVILQPVVPVLSAFSLFNVALLNSVLNLLASSQGSVEAEGAGERKVQIQIFKNPSSSERVQREYLRPLLTDFLKSSLDVSQLSWVKDPEFQANYRAFLTSCRWDVSGDSEMAKLRFLRAIHTTARFEEAKEIPGFLLGFLNDFKLESLYYGYSDEIGFAQPPENVERLNVNSLLDLYMFEILSWLVDPEPDFSPNSVVLFASPLAFNIPLYIALGAANHYKHYARHEKWDKANKKRVFFASYTPPFLNESVYGQMPFYVDRFSLGMRETGRRDLDALFLGSQPMNTWTRDELLHLEVFNYLHGCLSVMDSKLIPWREIQTYDRLSDALMRAFAIVSGGARFERAWI